MGDTPLASRTLLSMIPSMIAFMARLHTHRVDGARTRGLAGVLSAILTHNVPSEPRRIFPCNNNAGIFYSPPPDATHMEPKILPTTYHLFSATVFQDHIRPSNHHWPVVSFSVTWPSRHNDLGYFLLNASFAPCYVPIAPTLQHFKVATISSSGLDRWPQHRPRASLHYTISQVLPSDLVATSTITILKILHPPVHDKFQLGSKTDSTTEPASPSLFNPTTASHITITTCSLPLLSFPPPEPHPSHLS